jgi:hypothetical protein
VNAHHQRIQRGAILMVMLLDAAVALSCMEMGW